MQMKRTIFVLKHRFGAFRRAERNHSQNVEELLLYLPNKFQKAGEILERKQDMRQKAYTSA